MIKELQDELKRIKKFYQMFGKDGEVMDEAIERLEDCRFVFKIDNNKRGKIYVDGEWLHDVAEVDIHGEPNNYHIIVCRYKRDSNCSLIVKENEVERYLTDYYI